MIDLEIGNVELNCEERNDKIVCKGGGEDLKHFKLEIDPMGGIYQEVESRQWAAVTTKDHVQWVRRNTPTQIQFG